MITFVTSSSDRQPYDPDDRPPPRQVHSWTNVVGHQLIARDRATAFCTCGDRPKPVDAAITDGRELRRRITAWWDTHRAEAWPILLPKQPAEPVLDHFNRLSHEAANADSAWREAVTATMPKEGIRPGHPYPTQTEEESALEDRAECLRHQLNDLVSRHPQLRFPADDA